VEKERHLEEPTRGVAVEGEEQQQEERNPHKKKSAGEWE
jgi:hypothetical protein